jgi:hypothetical protein
MSTNPPEYRLTRAFLRLAALILLTGCKPAPREMANPQLKQATIDLAMDLRELQRKHDDTSDLRYNQRLTAMQDAQTKEERQRVWQEQNLQDSVAQSEIKYEFERLRVQGIALREELVRRLQVPPSQQGDDLENYARITLDDGMLAGVSPLRNLADYLEGLAVPLPD